MTLWRLATNIEYRTLSALFGNGRSTVGVIVVETTGIIVSNLFSRYISSPLVKNSGMLWQTFILAGDFLRLQEPLMGHIF